MFYLVWVTLIGVLAGWLAGQITKGRGFGVLGDLIVGIWGVLCIEPNPEGECIKPLGGTI